ncbi:MAG: hypothetical protein AABX96_04710 [Nanoarchaeota archaeon]
MDDLENKVKLKPDREVITNNILLCLGGLSCFYVGFGGGYKLFESFYEPAKNNAINAAVPALVFAAVFTWPIFVYGPGVMRERINYFRKRSR